MDEQLFTFAGLVTATENTICKTALLSSSIQEDITVDIDEKLLQELTVPELKERLRSNGQKVYSYNVMCA